MKIEQLLYVIIGGIIIADLVAHAAGTTGLFNDLGIIFGIATQPTNTAAIKTSTSVSNGTSGTQKV